MIENAFKLTPELAKVKIETVGLFPKGYVSIIAGAPAVGKTWFMLSITKGVIDGVNGLGIEKGDYPKGRVLIFAGETGVRLLAQRFYQLLPESSCVDNLRVISSQAMLSSDVDIMLSTALGRKNIEQAISEFKPSIVFFDTMISFVEGGKDESSQADMTDIIRSMSNVAQRQNCAIIMMHHFRKRKNGGDSVGRSLDEVIGTSAFSRLASVVVGLERKDCVRYCKCLKTWWTEFRPFAFRITSDNDTVTLLADYEFDENGVKSKVPTVRRIIREINDTFNYETSFSISDVAAAFNEDRGNVSLAITSMLNDGTLEKSLKVDRKQLYKRKLSKNT